MVARSPPKDVRHVSDKMPLESQLVKETIRKVDRAMARLQELQYTVAGGSKVRTGVTLSPRSTRGYMRTSLRCKQESLRIRESVKRTSGEKNGAEAKRCNRSFNPAIADGEIKCSRSPGEWRRWSLPAALVQQAVGEILEASNFAKEVANIVSDSIGNKLMNDPQTPQSAFNGNTLLDVGGKKYPQKDCKVDSVPRKDRRYNVQGTKNFNRRRYTLDEVEHESIKATQSALMTPPAKCVPLIGYLHEEGFDDKCFLDNIERLDQGNGEKKLQKVVHKFRMVTPENKVKELCSQGASSTLELRRKAEKQKARAKARTELSQASSRVRSQMSFRSSGCTNECGRNAKALASALVSCCVSPARSISEQLCTPVKPLVKADQITPVRKPWISHYRSTKAIMFPNPTFVPSPSDRRNKSIKLCQRPRCMASASASSVEKKSLASHKVFSTPKLKKFSSPLCKENGAVSRKMHTLKSSPYLNASKGKKRSPLSSVPIRTPIRMTKQSPVVKASDASLTARITPCSLSHKTASKLLPKLSPPLKDKSPKLASSSKKHVWFRRSLNTSRSSASPVICNISLLSKHPIDSPVQPLPSLISKLPSRMRRSCSPMPNIHHSSKEKVQSFINEEDVLKKTVELKGEGTVTVLPLPPDRRTRGTTIAVAPSKDQSINSSGPKSADFLVDERPCRSSVLERGRSISCPKQRPLKPIDNITNIDGIGNQHSNLDASETVLAIKRKDHRLQGKENRNDNEEDGHEAMVKKSNRTLRRSWSFGYDNGRLNNGAGGLPFLKYVRGLMNLQRTTSNINR
eukprot:Gb_36954 [translate_table: standard]